jgi:hypothetical protein
MAAAPAAAPGFSIAGPFHAGRGEHGLDLDPAIEKHALRLHALDGGPAALIGSHGAGRRTVGAFALAGGEAQEKKHQRQPVPTVTRPDWTGEGHEAHAFVTPSSGESFPEMAARRRRGRLQRKT